MHTTTQTLLDSTAAHDAHLMGFDGRRNPREDGEGLIITTDGFTVTLEGPEGCVELLGEAMIRQAIWALQQALPRPANCAGTQAVMEAIEASAKTGKAA